MKNWLLKHNWKISLLGIILLLITGFIRLKIHEQKDLVTQQFNNFSEALRGHERELDEEIKLLGAEVENHPYDTVLINNIKHFKNLEKKGLSLFVFEGENLKLWSSNSFPIPKNDSTNIGFQKLKNGWYELLTYKVGDKLIIGQLLLKKEYRYSNSYIQNGFNPEIVLDEHWTIGTIAFEDSYPVGSMYRTNLIQIRPNSSLSPPKSDLLLIVEWFGVFLIPIGLFLFAAAKKSFLIQILSATIIVVIRFLLLEFDAPINIKELELFQPTLFASSDIVPSLGDLFLHTTFTFFIVLIFYVHELSTDAINKIKKIKWAIFFSAWLLIYCSSNSIVGTIEDLVIDSRISLNLADILNIDGYSIFAFSSLGFIILTFFLLTQRLVRFLFHLNFKFKGFAIAVIFLYCLSVLIGYYFEFEHTKELLWSLPILLVLGYNRFNNKTPLDFTSSIFIVLVFSLLVTYTLEEYVAEKDVSQKLKLLNKQAQEKDPITHYLFSELKNEIENDTSFYDELKNNQLDNNLAYAYLKKNYFNRYWERYNLKVHLGFKKDSVSIVSKSRKIHSHEYFDNIIKNQTSYVQEGLYFNPKKNEQSNYLAIIQFHENEKLFLELDSKFKPEGLGFPVLLVNKQVEKSSLNAKYSFAKYIDEKLVLKKGSFPYSHTSKYYNIDKSESHFIFYSDEHEHLAIFVDNIEYIISDPKKGSWGQMASYSYFFTFFSIIGILLYVISRIVRGEKIYEINLKSRFQLSIISILFFSMLFIGWGSVFYIKTQFNDKNFEAITEKIKSVNIEVEHKLGKKESIDGVDKEYTEYILNKFSRVFFTDINLYSPNGKLIASSQPKVFEEGLVDKQIDANAFYQLHMFEKTLFVQVEDIENMSYLSAYVPFRNKNDELMAYLNLPYFAKSSDLKTEISDFIVALINIYVLLIVIALVFALIITNRITLPLRLIQAKMSQIQLGGSTELIEWTSKDEIGKLITEYNRMVVEIMESANRLAQSEREGAWREMAQQVAHEIKNPLTPMKLSIQHLQMRWNSMDPEDQEERFKNFAGNLIEQIDTLSAIATEFSSFAKMPDAVLIETDLVKIINSSVGVYDGAGDVNIKFKNKVEKAFVLSDKDQLLRVFNNVIKNAIQAIPDNRKGIINLSLTQEEDKYIIEIKDNGKGIPKDTFHKIFVPNFTTKSSGMGLGLAMVQKIIENSNGKITFDSTVDVGTTFRIELPVI